MLRPIFEGGGATIKIIKTPNLSLHLARKNTVLKQQLMLCNFMFSALLIKLCCFKSGKCRI